MLGGNARAIHLDLASRASIIEFTEAWKGPIFAGLVRTAPATVKWAWRRIMPLFVPFVPGASTPAKSTAAGCRLLFDENVSAGEVYDHIAKMHKGVLDQVFDPEFGKNGYRPIPSCPVLNFIPIILIPEFLRSTLADVDLATMNRRLVVKPVLRVLFCTIPSNAAKPSSPAKF